MYVKIKKPVSWVGPYQIAQFLCFWTKTKDEYGLTDYPDWVDKFGKELSKFKRVNYTCEKIHNFREWLNKPKIKIHKYDTWNMDYTLSQIILPMLEQLRETKHGSPSVDDEDVPEWLRSTAAPPKENEWDTDDNWHKRWDYVLDCMIWSFRELVKEDSWEDQFHSGVIDTKMVPCEDGEGYILTKGPNDTHVFDKEGYNNHSDRINNGLKLFGKYYRNLWD